MHGSFLYSIQIVELMTRLYERSPNLISFLYSSNFKRMQNQNTWTKVTTKCLLGWLWENQNQNLWLMLRVGGGVARMMNERKKRWVMPVILNSICVIEIIRRTQENFLREWKLWRSIITRTPKEETLDNFWWERGKVFRSHSIESSRLLPHNESLIIVSRIRRAWRA